MERIEHYDDYRVFLRDAYEDRRKRFPHFSYRYFCRKAGIASPSLYRDVVAGKRNLTPISIARFAQGLNLPENDAAFFPALVHFNQARTASEKQLYLEQMRGLRRRVKLHVLPVEKYEYYSKWYHQVVRELVCVTDWGGDYLRLARCVDPPITKVEARESVELLLALGLIARDGNGRYAQTQEAIGTGAEVSSLAVRAHNKRMAELAVESVDKHLPSTRDIQSTTIGITAAGYRRIKEEIREFKERVFRIVQDDDGTDAVYNLNVHLFPLSRTVTDENES